MTNPAPADVAQMYDAPAGQGGHIIFEGQFHWGYWDAHNPNASLGEAADRLTEIMIQKTQIGAGERFCDLGCGVGVPAMRIAAARQCFVDAITISKYQSETAAQRVEDQGMQDRVKIIHGNALEMPCADEIYHGGWFFETIFHMGHRESLREAARILKPGATLVIADLPTRPTISPEFVQFAKDKIHAVFIPLDDYPALLNEAGFDLIEIDDVTPQVIDPLVPKIRTAFDQYQDQVLEYVDRDAIPRWIQMFQDMCDNLNYVLITARKRM